MTSESVLFEDFFSLVQREKIKASPQVNVALNRISSLIGTLGNRLERPSAVHFTAISVKLGVEDLCKLIAKEGIALWMSLEEITKRKAIERVLEVNVRKGEDYQSGGVKFLDYWPGGASDIWVILWGKCLRLQSLLNSKGSPNFESIGDSCLDLIAYAGWTSVVWNLA